MGEEAKEITEKDRDSHQRIKEVRRPLFSRLSKPADYRFPQDLYAFQSKPVTDTDHAEAFDHVFQVSHLSLTHNPTEAG